MRFNATTKNDKIPGFDAISITKTGNGNFRGVWSIESDDSEFVEDILENDENILEYQL